MTLEVRGRKGNAVTNTVGQAPSMIKETAAASPVDHQLPTEVAIQLLESWKRTEASSPVSECPVLLGAVG